MYGDWSSGMKTWLHANKDIPDAQPPKWKYKVFFPTLRSTLCVFEDVDRAFLDAVMYFNPQHTKGEVAEVWTAWKKANNRKDKITDPKFANWILPDVAMLTHFRTQITYGVRPEQEAKFAEIDDEWIYRHLPTGMSKYPVTNKFSYIGLDWKIEEAEPKLPTKDPTKEEIEEIDKHLHANCQFVLEDFNLPTTKSAMALFLGKTHIDDLVMPTDDIGYINAAFWGQIRDREMDTSFKMEDFKKSANTVGKTFARIYAEVRTQGDTKSYKVQALEDCCTAMRKFHGPNIFALLQPKQLDEVLNTIARAFTRAWRNYPTWRIRQKLRKTLVNLKVLELRNVWRDTRTPEARTAYFVELNKDLLARWEEGKKIKFPYDYHRRGFKQEVMAILLNGYIKLNTPQEFIERLKCDITPRKDGDYTDDLLTTWFQQYRAEWNSLHPDDPIGRKRKQSKYAELFKDMDEDEIADYIDKSDLHRQMKKKLREKYLSKASPENLPSLHN